MLRKKSVGIAFFVSMLMLSVGAATQPASSCGPPCWCETIMQNTTISGLINGGESQRICFLGTAVWSSGAEVCVYALWRTHSMAGYEGQDMQAYIELAKISDNVYLMEIYHSWLTLSVDMPSDYKGTPFVIRETPHLLVLNITAGTVCP